MCLGGIRFRTPSLDHIAARALPTRLASRYPLVTGGLFSGRVENHASRSLNHEKEVPNGSTILFRPGPDPLGARADVPRGDRARVWSEAFR